MPNVLIAGVSTRAAADSAARAGYTVTALDAFGDLDQSPAVRGLSMSRDFGLAFAASTAARVAESIACQAVAYVANFENHTRAVRALGRGRMLLGNPPEVLRRVRDPVLLAETFARRGMAVPRLCHPDPRAHEAGDERSALPGSWVDPERHTPGPLRSSGPPTWLLKPRRSGGGHGIRAWSHDDPVPRDHYVQERIDGTPGSIAFVAAQGRAAPFCLTKQIVGDAAFGATGFQYCGNILLNAGDSALGDESAVTRGAGSLAGVAAEEFGLVGVNGIDVVVRDGVPYPTEVNPRYSASMELAEVAYGVSVFAVHAAACVSGDLPSVDLQTMRQNDRAAGKSIVFARHDVVCGDTRPWLDDPTVRDIPHPGEHIPAGHPVCTVFADAADSTACYAALVRRAAAIYETLESWATVGV